MVRKPDNSTSGLPAPTPAELRILQYLWEHGPSTVRAVHLGLYDPFDTAYTTVLKQMQIMHEKGLLHRDSSNRAHVYKPTRAREQVQKNLLKDFVSRVYQGSSARLVLQALGTSTPASADELDQIREFLDSLEADLRKENKP